MKEWLDAKPGEGKISYTPQRKALVFNSAKMASKRMAQELVKKLYLQLPPPEKETRRAELISQMDEAIAEFKDEEDVNDLQKLLPYGVAFHHSGLPAMIREYIEEEFQDTSGRIQLIVCTETLMIGMNLPADIVILYDGVVFRGAKNPLPLTLQEYQNFVGRAGRLSDSRKDSYFGQSFLLSERPNQDFNHYTSGGTTEILSPFCANRTVEKEIAPYFLSWIGQDSEVQECICDGLERSFYIHCKPLGPTEELQDKAIKIVQWMQKVKRKDIDQTELSLVRKNDNGFSTQYFLTQLGRALAPYALELETNHRLLAYLLSHRDKLKGLWTPDYSLSRDKTPPLPSAALLELLYELCLCEEIHKNPALKINGTEKNIRDTEQHLKAYLKKVYPENISLPQKEVPRPLCQFPYIVSLLETQELCAAVRAVILALWLGGCSMRRIRENTEFHFSISTSDIERLSEVAAYLMEAVSRCEDVLGMEAQDIAAMYSLSISMKYGVPRRLVPLANLHVRNVSRSLLLQIGREAAESGKQPVDYVLSSPIMRYKHLREALIEREGEEHYGQQLENKKMDLPDEKQSYFPLLQQLDSNQYSFEECVMALKQIFEQLRKDAQCTKCRFTWSENFLSTENTFLLGFLWPSNSRKEIGLQFVESQPEEDTPPITKIADWGQRFRKYANEIYIDDAKPITVLYKAPEQSIGTISDDQLVITTEMLGILLLAYLLEETPDPLDLLHRIFFDLSGLFASGEDTFFNSYAQIWPLVRGYTLQQTKKEEKTQYTEQETMMPSMALFYYPGMFDFSNNLVMGKDLKELP